MKNVSSSLLASFIVVLLAGFAFAADPAGKTRVLVVTGGHDFEQPQFFQLFKDNTEITYEAVEHPKAYAKLRPDAVSKYDVILLYDMYQDVSDEAKADFLALLKRGKGLVVMHHAIASGQKWPEYEKIIGAKYYLEPTKVNGVEKKRSAYQHDVVFKVQVPNPQHPVTAGMKEFEIHDETYKWFDVDPGVTPLLTSQHPESGPTIGWAKTYEKSRVVYIQLGHDHFAYENPAFRQVVKQAIRWTAGDAAAKAP